MSQARLAIQSEDWKQALALLEEAGKQLGDTVAIRLTTSLYWAARGGEESRPALDKLAEANNSWTQADKIRLLDGLANVRLSLGHLTEAMALWSQVSQLQPDNVRSHFRVYSLALSLGDKVAAAKSAAELRRLEGADGPHVLTTEALELIERAQAGESSAADKARSILARVATQRPGWEMVPMTQARLDEITGDTESAIVNYRRAVDVGSRDPAVLKRLVVLLLAKNRFDDAEQFVRQIRGDTPAALTKEIRRTIAESSLKSLDFDQAQTLARELVSPDSRDSLDQIWFGQMMAATGRLDEGQRALEKAVQLDPAKPGPGVSLVLFFARTNKLKEAESTIEKARQSIPADKAALSLAFCYEAIRRVDDAEKSYLAAVAAKPADEGLSQNLAAFYLRAGQTQKAEPILRSLMSPERKSPPAGAAWARRTLAAAIAPMDYPHYQEAIRLLNESKSQTVDSAADSRVLARILLSRPTTDHVTQAMQIFESLEASGKLMPAEQLLMAQACDAAGATEKADKRWTAVVSANERNNLILSVYIVRQLRNQNYDDARKWLSQVQQREPNSFVVLELAAQLMLVDKLTDVFQALRLCRNGESAGPNAKTVALGLSDCCHLAGHPSSTTPNVNTSKNRGLVSQLGLL
jgi:tetratricopeptide (TPR) repeat protein